MGFIPRPHQVERTLELPDLRSVITNMMGHLTWPAASLQARLWERLARWAGNHLTPQDGRFRQGMSRIWTTKANLCINDWAGIQIAVLDSRLRWNDGTPKSSVDGATARLL